MTSTLAALSSFLPVLLHLCRPPPHPPAGAADTTSANAAPASALSYAEQAACALIAHLGGAGLGSSAVQERTGAATVAALADGLLDGLLGAFPALYHSQPCYAALLVQLQKEEGDLPMGQV